MLNRVWDGTEGPFKKKSIAPKCQSSIEGAGGNRYRLQHLGDRPPNIEGWPDNECMICSASTGKIFLHNIDQGGSLFYVHSRFHSTHLAEIGLKYFSQSICSLLN